MSFRIFFYCFAVLLISGFTSCREGLSKSGRVFIIQPFNDFAQPRAAAVLAQIKLIHSQTFLRPSIPLPQAVFYAPRSRYRADSLISFLKSTAGGDTVVIGLTTKDISTTKGEVADWGVMGLAYRPGRTCIVSSFRLHKAKAEQFYKVAIHELGHTQGLPHCAEKTCYMRDAEGGNPIDEETGFCPRCKAFLVRKGWRLR